LGSALAVSKKKVVGVAFVAIMMIALTVSCYWFVDVEELKGSVDHKCICGIRDDVSYPLITFTPNGLVIDQYADDVFRGSDLNLTITSEIEEELESMGFVLQYTGGITLFSNDDVNDIECGSTPSYIIGSREDFNELIVGSNVSFEVHHFEDWTVHDVHCLG
jgi:hypothetical protein